MGEKARNFFKSHGVRKVGGIFLSSGAFIGERSELFKVPEARNIFKCHDPIYKGMGGGIFPSPRVYIGERSEFIQVPWPIYGVGKEDFS